MFTFFFQILGADPISLNATLKATASVFSNKDTKDLVLILAEDSLLDSNQKVETSLQDQYSQLKANTIKDRIERYAEDIQPNLSSQYPNLEVSIVSVAKNQSPAQISTLLKQAYFQNLNSIPNAKLKGVVIIGKVPLPVVNKNGNRFVSMYPYTDFQNPAYTFDLDSNFFQYNSQSSPEPEVWHGVIDFDDTQSISEYLDKNHLYHDGEPEFATFQNKIFYTEPNHDFKSFNQDLYASYKTYQAVLEEFTYNRFSRNLISLLEQSGSSLFLNKEASQSSIKQPDIFTKPILEKYITQVTDVFSVALRDQQQSITSTGRYDSDDYVSGLQGIARIDELSALYLKDVNDLLEEEITSILKDIQQDIPLLEGASLTPVLQVQDSNGDLITQTQDKLYFSNHSRSDNVLQLYLNLVPGSSSSLFDLPTDQLLDRIFLSKPSLLDSEDLIKAGNLKVHGTSLTSLNSPTQCRLYRGGGTLNPLDKTVRTHRGLILDRQADPTSSAQPQEVCYTNYDPNNKQDSWKKITETPSLFDQGINACTSFAGNDLQDLYRTDEVDIDFQSSITHEACSGMRLDTDYLDMLKTQYQKPSSSSEKQSQIEKLNSEPDYSNLVIASYNNQNIQLSNILELIPTFQSTKLNDGNTFDWHAFSSQILNNPIQKQFRVNSPLGESSTLKSLTLNIQQYETGKEIPSLIIHADPTPGMISKAFEVGNPDLPINATRYATFVDKEGRKQQVTFPNAFKAKSLPQFRQDLKQLEQLFNLLDPNGKSYDGLLQDLISSSQDEQDGQNLTQINQSKLRFLLAWQDLDLNQKYLQVHDQILSSENGLYLNNIPSSFEIAHIASTTTNTGLDFNLLDFQTLSPSNQLTRDFSENYNQQQNQAEIEAQITIQQDSVNLFEYFTDYLPSWYDEQQQKISTFFKPEEFSPQSESEVFIPYEELETQLSSENSLLINTELDQSVIKAGSSDSANLKISLQNDPDFTTPQVVLSDPKLATINLTSSNSQNGEFTFEILPKRKSGSLQLTIQYPELTVEPVYLDITIEPNTSENIHFKTPSTKLNSSTDTVIELTLTDQYGNPTTQNLSNLNISYDEPDKLVNPPSKISFTNGKASLSLRSKLKSIGNVYMEVSGDSIAPSYHKLTLNTELSLSNLANLDINALVLNLFLDKSNQQVKSTTQSILSNSKVQSISTLSTSLNQYQPISYIHPTGGVEFLPTAQISTQASISPQNIKLNLKDNQYTDVANIDISLSSLPISLVKQSENQIYLSSLVEGDIQQSSDQIQYKNTTIFQLGPDQTIQDISSDLSIELVTSQRPKFLLSLSGDPIAEITIYTDKPEKISILPNSRNPQLAYEAGHTMSNSNFPLGFILYNPNLQISINQLPQSTDIRPEDFLNQKQVGLTQGSKLVHLLASETPVGEANRPHLSEAGIVLGDPSVKLTYKAPQNLSNMNFNQTIGSYIGRNTNSQVVDIVSIEAKKVTFIAYQNGEVAMYNHQTKSFTPNYLTIPGGINQIQVANIQKNEFSLVFLTDQECVANDSCIYVFNLSSADKIGALLPFSPNQTIEAGITTDRTQLSTLNRLNLDIDSKPAQILFNDMNKDDLDDLLVLTEDKILHLFWNQNEQILSNGTAISHSRSPLDSTEELISSVLISGLTGAESNLQNIELRFPSSPTQITSTTQTFDQTIQSQSIQTSTPRNFASLQQIPSLQGSTIQVQDLNGNNLTTGDILRYTITLNNNSAQNYQNLQLSFPISSNLTPKISSLTPPTSSLIATQDTTNRPFVISNLNLSPNSIQKIQIDFTYTYPDSSIPSLISIIPDSKESTLPIQDGYPDIQLLIPGSSTQNYLYSDYDKSSNTLKYRRFQLSSAPTTTSSTQDFLNKLTDSQGQPIDLSTSSDTEKENFAKSLASQTLNRDEDNDGIIDIYDSSPTNSIQQAGKSIESAIQDLTCDGGGCLAVPFNHAFLVPDAKSPGADLPVFGWGCPPGPFIPPTWPPVAHQSCSGGRIYVSPTLTGEFAGSVCLGPYLAGQCFTFNMFDLGELCKQINQKVQDVYKEANDFIRDEAGGVITVGNGNNNQNQPNNINVPGFPKVITDWIANQWEEIQNKLLDPPDISVIYPSPDSLVGYVTPTNSQQERRFIFTDPYPECTNQQVFDSSPDKCGGLATFNDVLVAKSNAKDRASFNSTQDLKAILEEIALMPLFDIKYEKVYVNYPWIDPKELTDYSLQIDSNWSQFKQELFVQGTNWGCFANTNFTSVTDIQKALDEGTFLQSIASVSNQNPQVQAACVRLAAGFEGLDLNIKENLKRISQYRDIPKNIFRVENALAEYTDQVLQYAEVILENTLGWLTENTNNLLQWEQTVLEIETLSKDLKVLLDFSVDFMESCDDCRSNRTNDEGVEGLLTLFLNLSPDLPVIEVPKFPNITLDVSNIQAGIDITLPDLEFKKDMVTLPDINLQLALPDVPSASIGTGGSSGSIDGINLETYLKGFEIPLLPEPPTIDTKVFLDDLPKLPELEIPELPSIPKPPSIKEFTAEFTQTIKPTVETLSTITRIYCLITKGIVPIPEVKLKSQIETMTNRPLTPVLPVDIGFQAPKPGLEGEYIEEIIFKLTTQLNLEFPQIQEATESLATQLNSFSSNIADQVEQGLENNTKFLRQEINLESTDQSQQLTSFTDIQNKIQHLSNLSKQINSTLPEDIYLQSTTQKLANLNLPSTQKIKTVDQYNSHFLVQRQNQNQLENSNSLVASTENLEAKPLIKTEKFNLTNSIAQATSTSLKAPTTYNPDSGVYVVDQDDNIQKLINYSTPLQSSSKVDMIDSDNDGDKDVVYTIEDQIFFKQNHAVTQSSSKSISSAKIYEFKDLQQDIPALASITSTEANFAFSHNQVSVQLPPQLQTETLVLDIYTYNQIDTLNPHIRYIFSNQASPQVSKDNFQDIVYLPNSTSVQFTLSDGVYIGQLSLLNNQKLSIIQSDINIAPTTCGDTQGPIINIKGSINQQVPLFGNFDLDLSQTIDLETDLLSIYIDNDLNTDSNQDGDKTNDPNLQGQQNPAATNFRLGPFNKLETKKYQIYAKDINGNTSQTTLTLQVVSPEIKLSQSSSQVLSSQLSPISANVPITFVRQRNGILTKLGESKTDSRGEATLNTSSNTNSLIIKDSSSKPLFRINKSTGAIQILDPTAKTNVQPWIKDTQNTSVQLLVNQTPLTHIQKVADPAFTPEITSQALSNLDLTEKEGVIIQDTNTENQWRTSLVENNLIIYNQDPETPSASISSSGQIQLLDNAIQLDLSEITDINQSQWIQLYADSTLQFNLFIGIQKDIQIQEPSKTETQTTTITYNPSDIRFQDVTTDNPNKQAIDRLQSLNIIQGIQRDGQFFFEPTRQIQRDEYSKVILETLCLAPSEQAFEPPQVFDDIPFSNNQPWYYSYTKETQLLGLFNGYLGEINPSNNLPPFKPAQSITTAEAAKVILEALELKGVIRFRLPEDFQGAWYLPYLELSKDLTPYATTKATENSQLKSTFLLTPEEIANPNHQLTREEFATIASRVLDIYNCFEVESQNQTSDQETASAETQVELLFPQPSKPGIYVDPIPCNVCPCPYTLDYEDDIIKGDVIFSLLLGPNQQVYSQSNSLNIQKQ